MCDTAGDQQHLGGMFGELNLVGDVLGHLLHPVRQVIDQFRPQFGSLHITDGDVVEARFIQQNMQQMLRHQKLVVILFGAASGLLKDNL